MLAFLLTPGFSKIRGKPSLVDHRSYCKFVAILRSSQAFIHVAISILLTSLRSRHRAEQVSEGLLSVLDHDTMPATCSCPTHNSRSCRPHLMPTCPAPMLFLLPQARFLLRTQGEQHVPLTICNRSSECVHALCFYIGGDHALNGCKASCKAMH